MPDPISWGFVWHWFLLAVVGGYLVGSIPTGYILTRLAGLGDVRDTGSGGTGATNVLRLGGRGLSALTLAGDAAKGWLAAGLAGLWFGIDIAVLAAFGALLGHIFPIWLGFRGGKGVATYGGVLIGLHWPTALCFALIWLALLALSRRSSIASLAAALGVPLVAWFMQEWQLAEACVLFSALIVFTHRSNIMRLIRGEEPRIGEKK